MLAWLWMTLLFIPKIVALSAIPPIRLTGLNRSLSVKSNLSPHSAAFFAAIFVISILGCYICNRFAIVRVWDDILLPTAITW